MSYSFIISVTPILLLLLILNNATEVSGIEYLNYTNDNYKVQFEYPSTHFIDDQTPKMMLAVSNSSHVYFSIVQISDFGTFFGTTDLLQATIKDFDLKRSSSDFPVLEYKSPWITSVNGHKAGTYVITTKGDDADKETEFTQQTWLVNIGPHGYATLVYSPRDIFESSAGKEQINHFLNSVKFLSLNN